jgi:hypothetical protein
MCACTMCEHLLAYALLKREGNCDRSRRQFFNSQLQVTVSLATLVIA